MLRRKSGQNLLGEKAKKRRAALGFECRGSLNQPGFLSCRLLEHSKIGKDALERVNRSGCLEGLATDLRPRRGKNPVRF